MEALIFFSYNQKNTTGYVWDKLRYERNLGSYDE